MTDPILEKLAAIERKLSAASQSRLTNGVAKPQVRLKDPDVEAKRLEDSLRGPLARLERIANKRY